MILTQIEAKEACDWLKAAGFPQYAQLYEDSRFPIDISSVFRDHDFLDHDAIDALCRRLNTLNKCAVMRLEISRQRKRSEDSDEDEPCAISGLWTFQRDSRRWSRLDEPDVFPPPSPAGPLPGDGPLGGLSERPEAGSSSRSGSSPGAGTTRTSSVTSDCSSGASAANEDSLSEGPPEPPELPARFVFQGPPGGAKTSRSKAKSFLKRMESLRLRGAGSKRKRRAGQGAGPRPEISGPILRGDLDADKLRRLNCVDVAALNALNGRSRSVSHPCPARPGGGGSAGSSSAGSSQSEASSGSAVSTPSPVARARARARSQSAQGDRGGAKRGGMYLEGFDPFSLLPLDSALAWGRGDQSTAEEEEEDAPHVREEEEEEDEDYGDDDEEDDGVVFFLIPEGHKLGTFPKALCNSLPRTAAAPRPRRSSASNLRRSSAGSVESRHSFYDNVPARGPEEEEEEEEEEGGEDLEDTLRRVGGWTEGDSDSAVDSASPCPSSPLQGRPGEVEGGRVRDRDSTGNLLSEQEDGHAPHERRDSGVGTSLSQDSRPQKARWSGFQSASRAGRPASSLQIGCQSAAQMNLLQKFSLLTLTALLERYTPTSKHGFSWAVPKFMKRTKARDYRDRIVFGVPLQVNVQRTGQPLPPSIQEAMRYLREQGMDQVGLFRKSGVKSRIQALREMNEAGAEGEVSYEGQSAYDVADMLKQYFRDLPEPLLTSKLCDTFLQIYQYVPKDQRLQAARAAVLLLPDENREALQTLLCFLCDVVANVAENQMTSTNLAVCLAPTLFHLNTLKRDSSSPRVMQRKQSLGKPDQRDLQENLAATQGLAHMIAECKRLFQIPEEMRRCQGSYMDQGLHPPKIEELAQRGAEGPPVSRGHLREELDALLREAKDKFRGYDSCSTPEHAELAYKKVHDGSALRLWKATVEVPAPPEEVLTRVLRERHRWDEDLLEARVVETLGERAEVYQYLRGSMAPHPARDHVVLRTWVTDLPKGACALVSRSVDHSRAKPKGVRANVLTSCYYLEPCGPAKSRLTHLSRVDCRGRFPEWYNKTFGHLCAAQVSRIRDSFAGHVDK
ncbi:rho GTPase-activating protein 7-like isoform X1 [Anguilla rostrata]|uniref:rho GTPase-activating protein 7-like isoform X1 n=2 Tax=Anguilla rostrata TaxID=7938 RepID=UPI0030CD6646